ncbi:MAG: M48 family metalloprotease [Lachnospiraceae bacterium]|nr:M48 family metalloprotease [Lachnospiraceae bacterium]
MYLFNFIKQMTRKSNIPTICYLVLNVLLISGILYVVLSEKRVPFAEAVLMAIVFYVVSLLIGLSPLGEMILRKQTGCKKIVQVDQINYLEPIFREVYKKAKKLDPTIPDDVELYISSDKEPNAFATGRRTICVTEGLLNMPADQIKATLAHEFGHIAHKDTDQILLVAVGNLFVSAFIFLIKVLLEITRLVSYFVTSLFMGKDADILMFLYEISNAIFNAIINGLTWVWTKIGILLVMKSSRANEFEADEFAFNLGYGDELCLLLDIVGSTSAKGLFANLTSSHPNKADRISKLKELGATYRTRYIA